MKTLPIQFSQPVAFEVQARAGHSARSQTGRLVSLKHRPALAKNPASAVITAKTAHDAPCAGLRAGIRRALNVSQLPNSRFVDRQIAIHREYQSRQASASEVRSRVQDALFVLHTIAQSKEWSQRELAKEIGLKESTLRKIKSGRGDLPFWLPKLETALARLNSSGSLPQEVVA